MTTDIIIIKTQPRGWQPVTAYCYRLAHLPEDTGGDWWQVDIYLGATDRPWHRERVFRRKAEGPPVIRTVTKLASNYDRRRVLL